MKKKSTENYKAIPYVTTLLSTSLWTFYGALKGADGLLVTTVNAAGVAFQLTYVTLFIIFAPKRKKVILFLSKLSLIFFLRISPKYCP